jgi:hypothetical protein
MTQRLVSVVKNSHGVDVSSVADDSEVHAASMFRVMCILSQSSCVYI